MPSLPRSSQSRSARSSSIRSARSSRSRRASHRDTAQQTSESRSSSRRRTPTPSPTRPSISHPNRKRFGLSVPTNQARIGKFDFEDIYPEDPIYEELGPNARAWRVNLDECEVFDNDMVVEARDGLDLLLVFAGLFSAVLTTFVAQTSQSLSNNFPAVSTSLLLEVVSLQRAFINGTPIDGISSSEMTSGPSGFDVWVNALWFTSLTLSLGTALMAVLVKQWLYQYMSIVSGTARDRSLIRFYRFDGLRKWHVLTIIGTLPIVLHLALGLFLAGIVIFLIPLNVPLATIVGSITVVIYTMYTVSNILPIIYTQCPYRTPFSDILNVLMRPIFTLLSFISSSAPVRVLRTFFTSAITSAIYSLFSTSVSALFGASQETSSNPSISPKFPTLKDIERIAATGDEAAEAIACDALLWLYQMTSNPPTKSIVLQSLGCLFNDVSDRLSVVHTDLDKALEEVVHTPQLFYRWAIRPGQESRAERLLRAQRHIKAPQTEREWWEADPEAYKPPFHILAAILTYAPTKCVKSLGGEPRDWYSKDLLMHIMQEYNAGRPVLLPSALWQQFVTANLQDLGEKNTTTKLLLCQLALQSWDNDERAPPPFSGGVQPLRQIVIEVLPQNDLPGSEPLRQLFIINDCIVSELSANRNLVTDDAISILLDIWGRISIPDDSTSGDSEAVCRRAEKCILEVFVGDWWHGQSDTDVLVQCYTSIARRYYWYRGRNGVPGLKLFAKLFSEFCFSSVVADTSGSIISMILQQAFSPDVESITAYYTLLCGPESPLFSPRTKLSLGSSTDICCVIAAFVHGLARGSHPPALTQQCVEFLCDQPDRLFTVCRHLALEKVYTPNLFGIVDMYRTKETVTDNLLNLVHIAPRDDAWQRRTHYLVGIEPWDWPYFLIPEDHEHIVRIQERMQSTLKVLDDFFASLENRPNPPPTELQTGAQSSVESQPEPPTVVSPWRHVRQLVLTSRVFRSRASSSPAGIELARPPSDRSSRTSAGVPHSTLALEPAPNASQPGDDMV